ncbi:MAG: aldolase/citrate lyase family protein [Gammaproteobacteria bacterium]|nr:aldolase/citrate lyase family protein [Gammaproteobacteria bacterium]
MAANPFKAAIQARRPQVGVWSSLCSPVAAEIVAGAGFDWILFDTEHSPVEIAGLPPLLRAAGRGTASAAVRPAWNDPVLLKRILDLGPRTVLIPFIQNADEAAAAVAACRYPPAGSRGVAGSTRATAYGRDKSYLQTANEQVCVLAQLETPTALGNLESIAAVDGIDGVFIGPSDLAASMGHIGLPDHPAVQAAIKDASVRIAGAGKPAGILATSPEAALGYLDEDFTFVAAGVDTAILARSMDELAKRIKG